MRIVILCLSVIMLALSFQSCVPQKKYAETEATLKYYQTQANTVDSINYENQRLNDQYRQNELLLRNTVQELEQALAANQSLAQSNQDLINRYNSLIEQTRNVLTTSTYEKVGLQEQLSAQQAELDRLAREQAVSEYQLNQRDSRLQVLEGSMNTLETDIAARNRRIMELEALLRNNRSTVQDLRSNVNTAMTGFNVRDLKVEEKNGKLYLTLSQELLFPSGSASIDPRGRQALQQLASALNRNPEVDILVEGHTDTDGSADLNWELSTDRATSVAKALIAFGVDARRITAAGRAFYAPIAPNTTAAGKAQNRRTEIILSPKMDGLYQIMER
ncbi:MAG: OmpA family protein [Saprospiraceae bacterium]